MDTRIKKLLWFGVSTGIILGLIYFADLDQFIESVRKANALLFVPALVSGLAVFPVWAYVWMRVFRRSGISLGYFKNLKVFMAGFFMNSVTPLGQFGGEPIMAYIVRDSSDSSYERALSSVFSADVINAIPVITFSLAGAVYSVFFRSLNSMVIQGLYIALFVLLVGFPLMYLLWFEAGTIESFLIGLLERLKFLGLKQSWIDRVEEKMDRVADSFDAIGNDRIYLFETIGIAHIGFFLQALCLFFIIWSVGIEPDFTPIYFVLALSGLANFSPTPGGSGTFEAAMAGLITVFFPASLATGLTIAILFRLTTYWPGLVIGYFSLNSLNGVEE